MQKLRVLVTGGNRGIGRAMVQQFLDSKQVSSVTLTSRTEQTANAAVQEFKKKNPHNLSLEGRALDLQYNDSIAGFVKGLKESGSLFDVVILNAAIATKGQELTRELVDEVMQVNYHGTIDLAKRLIEGGLIEQKGKLVFTSSSSSRLDRFEVNKEHYKELCNYRSERITPERLDYLVQKFSTEVVDKDEKSNWPQSVYGASKMFLNLKVHSMTFEHPGYRFYCFDPGCCKTDMTEWKGERTAEEGASTSVYLALAAIPEELNGRFFRDNTAVDF